MLSPPDALEEHVDNARKAIKVNFKKDGAEIVLAAYFNLVVKNSKTNEWDVARKAYIAFGVSSTVKHYIEGDEHVVKIKPSAGIKKIAFFDPNEEEEDDRDKEHEAHAILGAVNLLLKKQLSSIQTEHRIPKKQVKDILAGLCFSTDF